MCSVDWGIVKDILVALIGAGIPSVVALFVFLKWKDQKGSELIASESRQVIKEALELVKIINYIGHGFYENEDLEIEIEKFLNGFESVVINTAYIEDCLIDDELKENLSIFSHKSLEFKNAITKEKKRAGDKGLNKVIKDFNEGAANLVNTLNPYSTFKKTCKFKLKK